MKKLFLIATLLTCSVSYGQGCSGNCYNGQDTYTWADGDIYVGDWRNGERTGQGTYTWANGDIYVGEFQDGKKHGQGTYTYSNGTIQSGIWENDTYFGTKAEWDAKERELKAKAERERIARETAKKKYNNIYNACLLDKSSGVDMQVNSLRIAVEETCESIAEDPSWLDNWKYN